MPPTTLPPGQLVINHPVNHYGLPMIVFILLAVAAGMAGGAMVGLLVYSKMQIVRVARVIK